MVGSCARYAAHLLGTHGVGTPQKQRARDKVNMWLTPHPPLWPTSASTRRPMDRTDSTTIYTSWRRAEEVFDVTEWVTVNGRVVDLGGSALVPAILPDQDVRKISAYRVRLVGDNLPQTGVVASVRGQLRDDVLIVSDWDTDNCEDTASRALAISYKAKGVSSEVSRRLLQTLPLQWRLISTGEYKTRGGGWMAVIDLYRWAPDVDRWLEEQAPQSVLIFPFIEDLGAHSPDSRVVDGTGDVDK